MPTPRYLLALTAIRWMALPPARPLARFAGTPAHVADELALGSDTGWRLAQDLMGSGAVSVPVDAARTRVTDALGSILSKSNLWSDEAVAPDPRGERFREAARSVPGLLSEPSHDPHRDEAPEGGVSRVTVL